MSAVRPDTVIVQELVVQPNMALSDFMRLFRLDEDLGLRFVREVNGANMYTTLQYEPDGSGAIRIKQAVPL